MKLGFAALAAFGLAGAVSGPVQAQDGESARLPDWLSVSGSTRARYETLDNRFRAGETGSDQVLATRLRVKLEAEAGPLTGVLELSDSRGFFNNDDSNVSTSLVNPTEILQAYVSADLAALMGGSLSGAVRAGRFTVDVGSRRLIGTSSDSNHPNTYAGLHAALDAPAGWTLTGFYTAPVERLPGDRFRLLDNEAELDRANWDDRLWGVHAAQETLFAGLTAEAYLFGLDEEDGADILVPGFRLYREPEAGAFDAEIEIMGQTGERWASDLERDVDVRAWGLFASAGYSFEARFSPRIALQYQYYSGEDAPGANRSERFNPFFGSRGGDIGMTGIFGPIDRENVSAPGLRLEVEDEGWEGQILYHAVWLASATDRWRPANLRDPSGASGRFIGHVIDAQATRELIADRVEARIGAVALLKGEFAKTAPMAPNERDSVLAYVELTARF